MLWSKIHKHFLTVQWFCFEYFNEKNKSDNKKCLNLWFIWVLSRHREGRTSSISKPRPKNWKWRSLRALSRSTLRSWSLLNWKSMISWKKKALLQLPQFWKVSTAMAVFNTLFRKWLWYMVDIYMNQIIVLRM